MGAAIGYGIQFARIAVGVQSIFTILNLEFETRSQIYRSIEFGRGGYNVDIALPRLASNIERNWRELSHASRARLVDRLHSLPSGLLEWDIAEMTFENKARWTAGVQGEVATGTLTLKGHVFPVSEVNYVLWGIVNRLACEDGIRTELTNLYRIMKIVASYRTAFGGLLAANELRAGRLEITTPHFESMYGKVAFTEYGWHLVSVGGVSRLPSEFALPNAKPTTLAWPGTLTATVADVLSAQG